LNSKPFFSEFENFRLKSFYKNKCIASKVNIIIPVPSDVYNPQFNEEIGRAKYDGSKEAISWKIDSLPGICINLGHKEFLLDASFSLPSIEGAKRDEF
jgi:AP-1 complex subunit mu